MSALRAYDTERLGELVRILPDVDDVEPNLTAPYTEQRRVLLAVGIESLDAVVRRVAFVDTLEAGCSARRLAHPRAVHEGCHRRGVPGRGRGEGVPGRARPGPRRPQETTIRTALATLAAATEKEQG